MLNVHSLIPLFCFASLLGICRTAAAVVVFSQGMLTPETISQVPDGFGTYGGSYFVPDAARSNPDVSLHNIWIVPQGGGAPSVFSSGNPETFLGGLFLPPQWGAAGDAGKFAVTTNTGNGGAVFIYDSDGTRRLLAAVQDTGQLNQPQIAPADFGIFGGDLIAPGFRTIYAITPGGDALIVARDPLIEAGFGAAFAPANFGALGGNLFVSNIFGGGGGLAMVNADGSVMQFATVPVACESCGGRQLTFGPPGFIPGFGTLLYVSISGSATGGGTLGDIFALDFDGTIVADFRQDLGLTKFDPRGMLFTSDGNLLISDTSDPILLATAADFRIFGAPEPSAVALLGIGLAALGFIRRRQA
jgi:hypothetical protein